MPAYHMDMRYGRLIIINRQELLAWLNNLLQLNLTKVEQCGTGYGLSPLGIMKISRLMLLFLQCGLLSDI